MDKRRSSFGSAPLGSSASGASVDPARDRGGALQSSSGDGAAEANLAGSGGAPSSLPSPSLAAAATARDENNAEEEALIGGGGIFKAISDAASQEGPLQGKAFDSYAFGPPVRAVGFEPRFCFPGVKERGKRKAKKRSTENQRAASLPGRRRLRLQAPSQPLSSLKKKKLAAPALQRRARRRAAPPLRRRPVP